jgi:hypothetical protein
MSAACTAASSNVANRSYQLIPQPTENILVLRKSRDDDKDWRHFKGFEVE